MNHIKAKKSVLIAGVSSLALLQSAGVAAANDQEIFEIEEIQVTATKRSENVKDVPLAISAYDGNFVKRMNLDDVKDLIRFTPGFAGDTQDSFVDYVNVRGISTNDFGVGTDPSVAFFKNGFYQGRNGSAVTSSFDMERAEVLRGPQGFLFGRSAIAGAISTHTAKPEFDTMKGYVDAGFGQRNIFEFEGAINYPFSDNFAVRLAAYGSKEDGFVAKEGGSEEQMKGGHKKGALRLTSAYKQDNFDVTTVFEYEHRLQSGSIYFPIQGDETLAYMQELFPRVDFSGYAGGRVYNADEGLGN